MYNKDRNILFNIYFFDRQPTQLKFQFWFKISAPVGVVRMKRAWHTNWDFGEQNNPQPLVMCVRKEVKQTNRISLNFLTQNTYKGSHITKNRNLGFWLPETMYFVAFVGVA